MRARKEHRAERERAELQTATRSASHASRTGKTASAKQSATDAADEAMKSDCRVLNWPTGSSSLSTCSQYATRETPHALRAYRKGEERRRDEDERGRQAGERFAIDQSGS